MSLAQRLRPSGIRSDKVIAVYSTLNDEDQAALRDALKVQGARGDYLFTSGDIARALQAEGHAITADQVRHLRYKLEDGRADLQ